MTYTEQTAHSHVTSPMYEEFSQLLLAEDLPLEVLQANLEYAQYQGGPFTQAKQDLHRAWAELELGLSHDIPLRQAEDHLDDADSYAERVLHNSASGFGHFCEAARLRLFLPRFDARRHGEASIADEKREIMGGLADLLDETEEAPQHSGGHEDYFEGSDHDPCFKDESDKQGVRTKLATELLLEHAGLEIYPSSPRERRGLDTYREVHDGYTIESDGAKIAYKVKFGREKTRRHTEVDVFFAYGALVRHAAYETGVVPDCQPIEGSRLHALADEATTALVQTTRGKVTTPIGGRLVRHMAGEVAYQFDEVRRTI
ncbi:MAG TPA: hypothetical protein VJR27_00545 [Candidatus Saccharimonadales bacterium]|nr:hypothetical protein [Candidatus Saccharimonadales bacterium]